MVIVECPVENNVPLSQVYDNDDKYEVEFPVFLALGISLTSEQTISESA